MYTTTRDVDWFEEQLDKSDGAELKRLYLRWADNDCCRDLTVCGCLGLQPTMPCSLDTLLSAARAVVLDERTLWECMGPRLCQVLKRPVDSWNEQLAVKLVHRFLQERTEPHELTRDLETYLASHIKPSTVAPLASSTRQDSALRAGVRGAVSVVAMDDVEGVQREGALLCARPVEMFGTLLRVPRAEMFFIDTVLQHSCLGVALAADAALQPSAEHEEALLVLCLIYERLVVPAPHSHWHHILASCPAQYPHMPLFWHAGELAELEGVDMVDDILDRRARAATFCAEVRPSLRRAYTALRLTMEIDAFLDVFSTDAVLWARATFDSRAFRLSVDQRPVLALVPLADMVNHCNASDILVRKVEPCGGDFVMQVGAPLTRDDVGRELWMSYGPLQNWELLQFYGFVVDDNPHDKLPFPLHPVFDCATEDGDEASSAQRRRRELVERYGLMLTQHRCWLPHSGVPCAALCALLRVCLASSDELIVLEQHSPFTMLGNNTELMLIDTIAETVQGVLELFSTTLAEDMQTLRYLSAPQLASDDDDKIAVAAATEDSSCDETDCTGCVADSYELSIRLRICLKQIAQRALQWCATRRSDHLAAESS